MPIRELSSEIPGLVAIGGNLSPETLISAYHSGVFPWPMDGMPLGWFCPANRAVLEFDDLHVPRSLRRAWTRFKKNPAIRVTFDQAFEEVITYCAKTKRPGQRGTWITPAMKNAYIKLHTLGHAHSFEVWEGEDLIGGIYGVDAGGVFAGESMFFTQPYASKVALLSLIEHLKAQGSTWMDIQMLTPHMEALGAKEIPREAFIQKLNQSLINARGPLFPKV